MRAGALAAALVLLSPAGAAACTRTPSYDPAVPTWEQVNHAPLGARAATDEEIERYLAAVDRASARVRTGLAARSVGGRPLTYAVVGRPAAIAQGALGRLAARVRALRGGTTSAASAARLAAHAPAFAWIGGSVHGDEPSGGDADMRLLYELAAGRDCATERTLARLDTFLLPDQNPDGRAADERTNGAGFDLNRDWFARTQPETEGKVAVLLRYPPLLYVDQHEQPGTSFFVPPNADPVHHEISGQSLHAIDRVLTPPVRRAFAARGWRVTSDATYDLFFMGYGDTAPTTLLGAAGMTFEMGDEAPYPQRVAEHLLAARTVLDTAAAHRAALLRAWAAQWREARIQGARGALQPNRVLGAGHVVSRPVPRTPVFGHVLRADVHGPDAARLADRLASAGVVVRRLAAPIRVRALRAFGATSTGPATLPAGTYVVPAAQGAKHWAQALLGDDAYVPFPYVYDVSAWSNPLLMGLAGGALTAPLPRTARLRAPGRPPVPAPGAGAYVFASGSEGAAELAVALLRRGVAVRRVPGTGAFAAAAAPTAPEVASSRAVVTPAAAAPADAVALHAPRVALLAAPSPGLSTSWARYAIGRRLGLPVATLTDAAVAAGALATGHYDALVVPGDARATGGPPPAALAALAAWVRTGGTLVGWRAAGLAVARAAGLTAVRVLPDAGLRVPGVALRTALDPADPVAWGEEPEGFAFDVDDPVLDAGAAAVPVRYPAGHAFWASGSAAGTDALRGTAAATDEPTGAGRVVLFAFDPAFRGYVEGTMRLLANALLAPGP